MAKVLAHQLHSTLCNLALHKLPMRRTCKRRGLMKIPGVFYNAKSFRDVPAGTVIFEEGASGAEMFGVLEGEVELRLPNGAVHGLGPDDTFG